MEKPTIYVAVDEAAGLMSYVSNYDAESLQAAEDMGVVFYAVLEDGSWEETKAADIKEPQSETFCIEIPQPVYIDTRMEAVVDVFDALVQSLPSKASIFSINSTDYSAFYEALANLRAIVNKEADNADS